MVCGGFGLPDGNRKDNGLLPLYFHWGQGGGALFWVTFLANGGFPTGGSQLGSVASYDKDLVKVVVWTVMAWID